VSNRDYHVSNEDRARGDLAKGGAAPPEEKAEYYRIYREALEAKLSAGTVHVYILNSAGHPIDSLHVAEAAKPERLIALLERAVAKLKPAAGEPVVRPCCQSHAPAADPGSLVLHLTARYLERKGDDFVRIHPVLGTERSGQWASLPSENWVVLPRSDWAKLLPSGPVHVGTSWSWDRDVAARLLTHFYPPTENNDVGKNRLDEQDLKATVVSVRDGMARARVEGRLKMKHSFYHKDTEEMVEADAIGFVDFDADRGKVRSLRLVTDRATYGAAGARQQFGVAVRSEP
jgi:hypothetical protein